MMPPKTLAPAPAIAPIAGNIVPNPPDAPDVLDVKDDGKLVLKLLPQLGTLGKEVPPLQLVIMI
jgi:hypothetical protein